MPAGVSVGQYIKLMTAAMVSMLAGAQTVHAIFKPLKDFDTIVEQEKELLRQQVGQSKEECPVKHNN